VGYVEVYEKSDGTSTEFQVRDDLCLMNGCDCFYGLQFYDDQIVHQQVDAIAEVQFNSVVDDWQSNLRLRLEAGFSEFMLQTGCVGALQKTGAQFRMNSHCCGYHRVTNFLRGVPSAC
jgi:hypothetical protein